MRAPAVCFMSIILTDPALADGASGRYGSVLAVVQDSRLEAVYYEARLGNGTSKAPQFDCAFLMSGDLRNGSGPLEAWQPGDPVSVSGQVTLSDDSLAFSLSRNLDGCLTTSGDMVRQQVRGTRDMKGPDWIGVALVNAPRVAIRDSPGSSASNSLFVLKGQPVVILAHRGEWRRIESIGQRSVARGWVMAAEITSSVAPAPSAP